MNYVTAFLAALGVLAGSVRADAEPGVTVFAAASLRGALEEIVDLYPGPVSLAFGGSGTMARQVAAGAPADVAVLASRDWMDWLDRAGLLPAAPRVIARNRLVLIAPAGHPRIAPEDIEASLGADGRLAIGQRAAVPAGVYARQWLEHAALWETLVDRLAETDNVQSALMLVARGDAPLGVVYASDAQAEPRVAVVYEIAAEAHDPITYPAVALTPEGAALVELLGSEQAQAILAAHGFLKAADGD